MDTNALTVKGFAFGIFMIFIGISIVPSIGGTAEEIKVTTPLPLHKSILSTELPSSFDWRNINGVDYTTPIRNQAPAPTCEAYGLCAALETIVQYTVGHPFGCDLSEAHLFFYAGGSIRRGGVRLTAAADYLVQHGVPDEGCFPDPHRPYDGPYESVPGWENRTVKITTWGWVEKNETAMKQALIMYGPLVVCIYNRNDFLYYRHGIYMPKGTINGGHVVAIIGYNDTQRCWIIKNSAGERWGENGYVRISYDADTADHPFFADFYGGTGILYVDGVYGNFMPDVPKVSIETPAIYSTYLFGYEFPTLLNLGVFIQSGAPRIFGKITVIVSAFNTDKVEFYLNSSLEYTDGESPYKWILNSPRGLHTVEIIAYHNETISKALEDVYEIV